MSSKKRSEKKNNHKRFFDNILESLFSSIEENAEDVLEKIGNFLFMKKLLKKYIIFMITASASLVIILYGLGLLLINYIKIDSWIIYLGIGIITFIISWVYLKSK